MQVIAQEMRELAAVQVTGVAGEQPAPAVDLQVEHDPSLTGGWRVESGQDGCRGREADDAQNDHPTRPALAAIGLGSRGLRRSARRVTEQAVRDLDLAPLPASRLVPVTSAEEPLELHPGEPTGAKDVRLTILGRSKLG